MADDVVMESETEKHKKMSTCRTFEVCWIETVKWCRLRGLLSSGSGCSIRHTGCRTNRLCPTISREFTRSGCVRGEESTRGRFSGVCVWRTWTRLCHSLLSISIQWVRPTKLPVSSLCLLSDAAVMSDDVARGWLTVALELSLVC